MTTLIMFKIESIGIVKKLINVIKKYNFSTA